MLAVVRFFILDVLHSRSVRKLNDGDHLIAEAVPYQCQFATPKLTADILEKRATAEADPNWQSFGFRGQKEYAYWSWRVCAIACLKMILDFYHLAADTTMAQLTDRGVTLGGYNTKTDEGWFFKPLLALANSYGLTGFVGSRFGLYVICDLILNKKFFVASVNPSLVRFDPQIPSSGPGGHLALIIGFKMKDKNLAGFFIHNPSGKSEATQKRAFVPIDIFKKAYSKRGIAIWK